MRRCRCEERHPLLIYLIVTFAPLLPTPPHARCQILWLILCLILCGTWETYNIFSVNVCRRHICRIEKDTFSIVQTAFASTGSIIGVPISDYFEQRLVFYHSPYLLCCSSNNNFVATCRFCPLLLLLLPKQLLLLLLPKPVGIITELRRNNGSLRHPSLILLSLRLHSSLRQ